MTEKVFILKNTGEVQPKLGNIYGLTRNGQLELYILAQVDAYKIALISLKDGNRYDDPAPCEFPAELTPEEFDAASHGEDFRYIRSVSIGHD